MERRADRVPGAKHFGIAAFVIQPSNVIAMLLLVASCRSLTSCRYSTRLPRLRFRQLADNFGLDFVSDKNKIVSFLSDRSLAGIHTQNKRHAGTIRSRPGVAIHPHASTTPTTRGRTRISSGLITRRTVWKSQSLRPFSDWLGFVC